MALSKTELRNPATMHLDHMSTAEILQVIQNENRRSVEAVEEALSQIAKAVDAAAGALEQGGRILYIGAGTSGRIAAMDAAECPPTFGVPYEQVVAIMAGGDSAFRKAAEGVEDSGEAGKLDLLVQNPSPKDFVMGISASGNADYVASALQAAKEIGCTTVALSSNEDCKIGKIAEIFIYTDTGAEVVTGSTRMKAGNAQKLVLNMISTGAMVKTGKVCENLMINLRPTNQKLRKRMIRITSELAKVSEEKAESLLEEAQWKIRDAVAIIQKVEDES